MDAGVVHVMAGVAGLTVMFTEEETVV